MSIKQHIKNHKSTYIAAGVGIVVGAAGVIFISSTSGGEGLVQKIYQVGFRNEANPTIINLIERSTPSKPVHLVGTNLYFNSISEAARETGHTLSEISKQINGHIADVKGDVFELLELAA